LFKQLKDAIKIMKNPYPLLSMLFVLLAIKYFTPSIINQLISLSSLRRILPELFIVLKAISVGMYLYGMAGAILLVLCRLISFLEEYATNTGIRISILPEGWVQATWDIYSLGIIWFWITAGYIIIFGGQPWLPEFAKSIEDIDILQTIALVANSFVWIIFLWAYIYNLLSPRNHRRASKVWVVNPIELKNHE